MKKLLFIALTAFAMTNCARESVIDSDLTKNGNTIGFSSYSNITRGMPINDNTGFSAIGNSFGVTAFINNEETKTLYMGAADAGAQIISKAEGWDYVNSNDSRYWPTSSETLDFYAYAPFASANTRVAPAFTETGMVFNNYVVPEASLQDDFMYASSPATAKPEPIAALELNFKHALTQVLFKIKTANEGLYVDIEADGIKLNNIASTSTFTLGVNAASWGTATTPVVYAVPAADGKAASANVIINGENYTPADFALGALMLLPQVIAPWDGTAIIDENMTSGYLSLSCKIYHENNGTKVYLKGSDTAYATINVPFSSNDGGNPAEEIWTMRKKITYTLNIDGTLAGLVPIKFTTTVENWEEQPGEIKL